MDFPEELKYSKEHFWVRVEGNRAVIGITDYAQKELGVITSVELPEVGYELEQDDSFGSIEARKTVADLYAPVGGAVLASNEELVDAPELINDDPYDGGWFVEVELSDKDELNLLMTAEDYQDYVAEEE
ncbi:glycine cleavage system H protein [Geobacter sp. OR-1]|uniref:glycine cleavage system protein GcvH n=1 Tax=Geobacter sp. OR-1 TaxID=1266765 RepID=UPI000542965E|nr:glycine cleavage system protein GcvH [Geobacter sp. OR-1]GAM07830.1 glycine cleavage system H protein [Geobacter sp. OR-1]